MAKKTKATKPAAEAAAPAVELPEFNDRMHTPNTFRLPLEAIRWDEKWERESAGDVEGLARSIAANGLRQPIGVIREGEGYRGVFGRRRYMAHKLLEAPEICCTEVRAEDEPKLRAIRHAENLDREPLGYVEEANVVAEMIEHAEPEVRAGLQLPLEGELPLEDATRVHERAIGRVAALLGKTPKWVRERDFIATATGKVRAFMLAGQLPMPHARLIMQLADPEARDELAMLAAAGVKTYSGPREHPMEFRELQRRVEQRLTDLQRVPWLLEVPFAGAAACTLCPHNSANAAGLFEVADAPPGRSWDKPKKPGEAVCRLRSCYGKKSGMANRAALTAAKRALKDVADKGAKLADAIEAHRPEFVPLARVQERARELKKREAEDPKAPAKKPATVKTAETLAAQRLNEARYKWRRGVFDSIEKKLSNNKLAMAALSLLTTSREEWDGDDRDRRHSDALLEAVAVGTPAGLAEVAQRCSVKHLYIEDAELGVLDLLHLAGKLGLEAKPLPQLEQFLPKPKPAKKTGKKAAKKVGKKKAAKKTAKAGTPRPPAAEPEDEGEDDPELEGDEELEDELDEIEAELIEHGDLDPEY